jgi:DUF4097 and DUF4098 domain-containing protein YvlB
MEVSMSSNSKVWLIMAVFLAVIISFCGFLIMFFPRGGFMNFSFFNIDGGTLRYTTTLSIGADTSIDLRAYSENIFYLQSDNDDLIIKEYYNDGRRRADINQSGQSVTIQSERQNSISFGFGKAERIEVYLPKNYVSKITTNVSSGNIRSDLDFTGSWISHETSSGNITLAMLSAPTINLRASSGNIRVASAIGDVSAKTSSGTIRIEEVKGFLNANASSGAITIGRLSGGAELNSSSGNIRIDITELKGDIYAKASSGSVTVEIPSHAAFNFSADTNSGSIRKNFDNSLSFNRKGNQATGTVGSESPYALTLRASSGNIRVTYN